MEKQEKQAQLAVLKGFINSPVHELIFKKFIPDQAKRYAENILKLNFYSKKIDMCEEDVYRVHHKFLTQISTFVEDIIKSMENNSIDIVSDYDVYDTASDIKKLREERLGIAPKK